jgi:DNA-binding ferritin-like protein (Dps family)
MEKMLSKEADQFMLELRMYLMSKGKNEQEINEITAELEDHLLQAEAEGKSIKDVTGDSPREYMKSIGQEMGFDAKEVMKLIPMTILLLAAFMSFTSALRGDFTLSKISVWGSAIVIVLGILLYGFLLLRVLPKVFYSKWFYVILIGAFILMTGFFLVVELLDRDPFFIATPLQNNLIVIGCLIVFIVWAFYAKTWVTILIPFFLSWAPLAERFIPAEINEDPFFITITAVVIGLIALIIMAIFYFNYRKRRNG